MANTFASISATTAMDFAQAFAQNQTGGFIGNTGYGLGDTTEIAFSEKLMFYFAQELGSQTDMPIGEALRRAKERYVSSAPSGGFSTYDEKVMIESTLYGLPMYKVSVPITVPISANMFAGASAGPMGMSIVQHSDVSASDAPESVYEFSFEFITHTVPGGTYYTVGSDGDIQAGAGRPIQPLVITDIVPPQPGLVAHGVVVLNSTIRTITPFDPAITTLVTDTGRAETEFTYNGWYPTHIVAVNRLGDVDRLVIVPAQFHAGSQTERLYQELTVRVYFTDSTDYTPPSIWSVESEGWGGDATFAVEASDDESGIANVWCMYNPDGDRANESTWQTEEMDWNPSTERWELTLELGRDVPVQYIIQVVDGAGNVSSSSNKGIYFAAEPERTYLPFIRR